MQEDNDLIETENDFENESDHPFVATIRINAGQGLRVASKQIEQHLRNIKLKPIKIKLR